MALTRTRLIVLCVGFFVTVGASLYAFHLAETFLIRDARFALPAADGTPQGGLRIAGLAHASAGKIDAVFADDIGHSVYMIPLAERQAALREVPWVREASVARVWPNHIVVEVTERRPVAFIVTSPSRFELIDADGVTLPSVKDHFHLPVLTGIKASDDTATRRQAVQLMLRVTSDLGPAVSDISEIDVSVPAKLAVTREFQGRMRRLLLGDQHYNLRYQNFLKNFGYIDAKAPNATVIDLRLEDRITVLEAAD